MTSFVKDLTLHVKTLEVKTSVQTQHDMKLSRFLDELRVPLHLSSSRRWQVYDSQGRRLDHDRTLNENGLGEGDEIEVREEKESMRPSPTPSPAPAPSPSPETSVLKRCDNAHYYDPKKFRECPYCEARKRK